MGMPLRYIVFQLSTKRIGEFDPPIVRAMKMLAIAAVGAYSYGFGWRRRGLGAAAAGRSLLRSAETAFASCSASGHKAGK